MMGCEQGFALLRGEFNVVFAVAITEIARDFGTILCNQTAHKPADAQAQVVIGLPLFMPGFDKFLLVVDITQDAKVVVQAGKYAVQPA